MEEIIFDKNLCEQMPEEHVEIIQDYFLAIRTILKTKSIYPLKPAGVIIYEKLSTIKESLDTCCSWIDNPLLAKVRSLLSVGLAMAKKEALELKIAYLWIHKIASLLDAKKMDESQAKIRLIAYIGSIQAGNNPNLVSWAQYVKRITHKWVDGLFVYLVQPLLPTTNNDLEQFNLAVKKVHRKITGHKNTQRFLSRSADTVALFLSILESNDIYSLVANISHSEFVAAREGITQKILRQKLHSIKHCLDNFIFDLEVKWSLL